MHQAPCAPFFFAHRQARGKGPSETLKGVDGPFPLPAARRRPHPNRQPFAGGAADTAVAGWVGRSPRARRGGAWHFFDVVFYQGRAEAANLGWVGGLRERLLSRDRLDLEGPLLGALTSVRVCMCV